jgi:hypothetical protein
MKFTQLGAFVPLALMGGTALRFLYAPEDLGFTLERDREGFVFRDTMERIERGLRREGYSTSVKLNDSPTVAKSMIGFPGLLAQATLSPHADEVLWIKIEVDANPPAGAGLSVTMVNRFGPLRLQHHDVPSLFAGKIAAVLAREFTKGRDLYDINWYLSQTPRVEPNAELLQNALRQTAPALAHDAGADWRAALRLRLAGVDWADARRDVAPFLEQSRDLALIESATFEQLLA